MRKEQDMRQFWTVMYLWSSRWFQQSQKDKKKKKQVWVFFFFFCSGVKGVTCSHISEIFFIIKWIGNFFIINNYIFLRHMSPGAYREEKYIYCKPMIKLWKHQLLVSLLLLQMKDLERCFSHLTYCHLVST